MKVLTYFSFIGKIIYLFPQICELKSCFHNKVEVFAIMGAHYKVALKVFSHCLPDRGKLLIML
jgi:hypothetical protein